MYYDTTYYFKTATSNRNETKEEVGVEKNKLVIVNMCNLVGIHTLQMQIIDSNMKNGGNLCQPPPHICNV